MLNLPNTRDPNQTKPEVPFSSNSSTATQIKLAKILSEDFIVFLAQKSKIPPVTWWICVHRPHKSIFLMMLYPPFLPNFPFKRDDNPAVGSP